jgi:hypothetical protein
MITKPTKPESTSKAREAVEQARSIGTSAGETARGAWYFGISALRLWFIVMFSFGVIMSSGAWWFKLACLGAIFAIFYLTRRRR